TNNLIWESYDSLKTGNALEPDAAIRDRAQDCLSAYQRLDFELCRFAAHRIPAIDMHVFAGTKGRGGPF
ncbi:hypothetical protein, partial [Mesorhizobium sp. Mes31]|uniref:hypothetical protein n=1 Tax=Mesorhizobium sp. Mes31 TaxID=2926017 RepID=UPI002118230C